MNDELTDYERQRGMIHKHDLQLVATATKGFCLVDSLLAAIAGIVIEGSEPRTCSSRLWSEKMIASNWDGSSDAIGTSKLMVIIL